jgi:hypothetical protein
MARRRPDRRSIERPAAYLDVKGTRHFLGRWNTEQDAAMARDRAILHFRSHLRVSVRERARRLGPASPDELRRLARTAYKAAIATSRFHGVSFDRNRRAFCAQVRHNRKRVTIGFFGDENEAAIAVDRVSAYLGLAVRNFPRRNVRATGVHDLRRELCENPRSSLSAVRKNETSSRFSGVLYCDENSGRPWVVYFAHRRRRGSNGRRATFSAAAGVHAYVGSFESERDAALAHDRLALYYHQRPVLNFPSRARTLGPATIEVIRADATRERKEKTTSQYRGVYRARSGRWVAQIQHKWKRFLLGTYDVEVAAAQAYDDAAWKLKGENARVNFPSGRRVGRPGKVVRRPLGLRVS